MGRSAGGGDGAGPGPREAGGKKQSRGMSDGAGKTAPAAAAGTPDINNTAAVLLYVPNLIGYARLLLLVAGFVLFVHSRPVVFLVCYALQASLDGIDGWMARRLNQTSLFGAWLDVAVDNVGRTWLWAHVSPLAVLMGSFEWLVFVCTHTLGAEWKSEFDTAPAWVARVMANGFRTAWGVATILGLHGLPILLYARQQQLIPGEFGFLSDLALVSMVGGRILCAAVEGWCVYRHILQMLHHHATAKR